MINAVDDGLEAVLRKEFGKAFAPAEMPQIVFGHPSAVAEGAPPTITLHLYGVRENTAYRQDPFVTQRRPDGQLVAKGRSTVRFDLTYALSGQASDARAEHALLTYALGAFLRNPVVPLPRVGDAEPESMTVAVAQPEHDAPSLWPAGGRPPGSSVTLRVTAPFNPFDTHDVPLVRQAIFGYGAGTEPGFLDHPVDVRALSLSAVGVVCAAGRPLANVLVSVADRLTRTTTDEDGRFLILNLPPGRHTLVFEKRGFVVLRLAHDVPTAGRLHEMDELDVTLEPLGHEAAIAAAKDQPAHDFSHLLRTDLEQRTSVVGRLRYPDGRPAAYVPVRQGTQSTVTDSQGVYALSMAPFGTPLLADIPGRGAVEIQDDTAPRPSDEESEAPAKAKATKAGAK